MSEPHTIPPHEPLSSENDPTGRWRIAELEAEVARLTQDPTYDWLRESIRQSTKRAESAEADLADCAKTCGGLEYRLEQAEAALEEAITYTIKYGPYQGSSRETVWADLRARAEEGSEDEGMRTSIAQYRSRISELEAEVRKWKADFRATNPWYMGLSLEIGGLIIPYVRLGIFVIAILFTVLLELFFLFVQ